MKQGLFIGELSHRVDVPTQTIRYYERLGLLDAPERTESQYRIYSEEAVERLQFIQKAKLYGLSLDEIKQLIKIRVEGVPPCASLKRLSLKKCKGKRIGRTRSRRMSCGKAITLCEYGTKSISK